MVVSLKLVLLQFLNVGWDITKNVHINLTFEKKLSYCKYIFSFFRVIVIIMH